MGAVDPAGTKNQNPAAHLPNSFFAGQLARAISIQRSRRILLCPLALLRAIEDIIRGVMHQQRIAAERLFGQNARRLGVDGHGQRRLRFRAVHGSVCGGVENNFRLDTAHQLAHLIRLRQIDAFAIHANDFSAARKAALQLDANLPGIANNENARQAAHGKSSASRSATPWRSLSESMTVLALIGHGIARPGSFHTMVRSPSEE